MKKFLLTFFFTLSVFVYFVPVSYALVPIVSSFEVNGESWTADGAAIFYENTGGNPGGFLRIMDNRDDSYSIFAPAKFRGDLSGFDGGMISYDILQIIPSTPLASVGSGFGRMTILGGGLSAQFDYAPDPAVPSTQDWTRYTAPLNAAAWGRSQEDWGKILSNVVDVSIVLDLKAGEDTIGFDNFEVQAVPEPATLSLIGVGLAGLMIKKKKRFSRRI